MKAIPTLDEQDALTKPASPTANAATADVVLLVKQSLLVSARPSDAQHKTMGDLVQVEDGEQVGSQRRRRYLQEWCRTKRRTVPESMSEVVGLAVELVADVVVTFFPGAELIFDPRVD